MPDLRWFELFLPRGLDLGAVTALIRPLASRPRMGMLLPRMPVVVFECWSFAGELHWLLGVESIIAARVPSELEAQLPGLSLVEQDEPRRPVLAVAVDLRLQGLSNPLRVDVAAAVSAGALRTLGGLHRQELAVVSWVLGPSQQRRHRPVEVGLGQVLGLRPLPEETAQDRQFWKAKTAESLFAARGRIGVKASSQRASVILRSLASALAIANASHAELRASSPSARKARQLHEVFRPSFTTWGCVLNAAELATLLAWPLASVDVPGVMGRHVAPAPPNLLVPADRMATNRTLGTSLHPADGGQLVRLPIETCLHHVHVVGPTGSGKSTLLTELVRADAASGRAILCIEPRGDLTTDILTRIPEHRRNDVVIIEPGVSHPVGVNPLAGPVDQAERRADELVNLFQAWFGSNIGPRSRDILLHCLIALARLPDGTLADLPTLLTSTPFRRKALGKVSDPLVLNPFFAWYESISEAERSQAVAPVLNKARSLLSPSATRRFLGQATPKFDLEDCFVSAGSSWSISTPAYLARRTLVSSAASLPPSCGQRSNAGRRCQPNDAIR
jgi:hypothetical protein